MKKAVMGALVLLGWLFLGGCAGNAEKSQDVQPDPSSFDDIEVQIEQLGDVFLRNGIFIPAQSISGVTGDIGQGQVRKLLGEPLARSGEKWWFYNINLPMGSMDDYLVCQYRVAFDDKSRLAHTTWRRPQCRALYQQMLAASVKKEDVTQKQEVTLSSEALFIYDSVDLMPAGQRELDMAVKVLLSEIELVRITIVGHTDRIGSRLYNLNLSRQRAEAVGSYFREKGISGDLIVTEGRGSSEPVAFCNDTRVTTELKRCLQPNRRVHITIEGLRRVTGKR